MELDHIEPIICKICQYKINDYQTDAFTCPCGRVFCPNCKGEIPQEKCQEVCVF